MKKYLIYLTISIAIFLFVFLLYKELTNYRTTKFDTVKINQPSKKAAYGSPVTLTDFQSPSSTTKTYLNEKYGFKFDYPDNYRLSHGAKIEGVIFPDTISISKPRYDGSAITIFLPTNEDFSANKKAKTLDDYSQNYTLGEVILGTATDTIKSTHEVIIHEQKLIKTDNSEALRQIYSNGFWDFDLDYRKFFTISEIGGVDHGLRYVFYNKSTSEFVIINSNNDNSTVGILDNIAKSFRWMR